jgi:HMG-box domain
MLCKQRLECRVCPIERREVKKFAVYTHKKRLSCFPATICHTSQEGHCSPQETFTKLCNEIISVAFVNKTFVRRAAQRQTMNPMNDESIMQMVRDRNAAYRYNVLASSFPGTLHPTPQNRSGAFLPLAPQSQLQDARANNNQQALLVHQHLQAVRLLMAQESLLSARARYPLTHMTKTVAIRDCQGMAIQENHDRIERQSQERRAFNLDAALLATMSAPVEAAALKVSSSAKAKRAGRKKPKDQPKRALSAYNIFFQEERQRIMKELPSSPVIATTETHCRSGRPSPQRKIGFVHLAQTVAQRWQGLSAEQVVYYQDKANQDKKRFQDAMIAYHETKKGVPSSEE